MTTALLEAAAVPTDQLPDMPIEPAWIQDGNPVARGQVLSQSADKCVSSGVWSCEEGKFEWTFGWDEFVYVLEGVVHITEDGSDKTVTLRSGDSIHFPIGLKTHWHVEQAVRKFFVIRTPEPFEL